MEERCCSQLCTCTLPYAKTYLASGTLERWRADNNCASFPCPEARCAEATTAWHAACVGGECVARSVSLEQDRTQLEPPVVLRELRV